MYEFMYCWWCQISDRIWSSFPILDKLWSQFEVVRSRPSLTGGGGGEQLIEAVACYKDTIRTKNPIKYHVWTTRPTQHHVRTFKTTPCHVRTIIPTNYNYLQLLQIMSGLSDPQHTHMTGLAKLLHEMTFITSFHHKWTIEATSRRWV